MPGLTPRLQKDVNPDDSTLDRDGFVGADPIYQNAANDYDVPVENDTLAKVAALAGSPQPGIIVSEPVTTFSKTEQPEEEKADATNQGLSSQATGVSRQSAAEKVAALGDQVTGTPEQAETPPDQVANPDPEDAEQAEVPDADAERQKSAEQANETREQEPGKVEADEQAETPAKTSRRGSRASESNADKI